MSIKKRLEKIKSFNTEDIVSGIIEYQLLNLTDENRLYKCELLAGLLVKNELQLAGLLVKNELQLARTQMKMKDFEVLYDMAGKEVDNITATIMNESIKKAKKDGNIKDLEKAFQMRIKHLYHRGV